MKWQWIRAGERRRRRVLLVITSLCRQEDGSAALLAVVSFALCVVLTGVVVAASVSAADRARVQAVADQAALAAADARAGLNTARDPCFAAERTAEINGVELMSCVVEGLAATVSVKKEAAFGPFQSTSRAGPSVMLLQGE